MSHSPGQYSVRLPDGEEMFVAIHFDNGHYIAEVEGGRRIQLSVKPGRDGALVVGVDGRTYKVNGHNGSTRLTGENVDAALGDILAEQAGTRQLSSPDSGRSPRVRIEPTELRSPLTGMVIDIRVEPGEVIERGQTLVVIEAMKMENRIAAASDGRVGAVLRSAGETVRKGDVLLTLEPR